MLQEKWKLNNELKDEAKDISRTEEQNDKKIRNRENMRKIKNPSRRCNICIIRVPRMKKRENSRESGQRNKFKIISHNQFSKSKASLKCPAQGMKILLSQATSMKMSKCLK